MATTPARKIHPLTRRGNYSHWVTERVRFADTDMLGHVNHSSFAIYCESGRATFMRELSGGGDRDFVFVVARFVIDFLREVHWPGEVEIGSAILAVGRSSFTICQGLFVNGECVATAETVGVVVDAQTHKPIAIADAMRARLEAVRIAPD